MSRTILSIVSLLASAFFLQSGAERLAGSWKAEEDTNGFVQTFQFLETNRVNWVLESDEEPITFELTYDLDADFSPHHLDLTGFDWGPLAGKTLYCILEFTATDAFRIDCEPGSPDQEGARNRPREFDPEDTLTYRRRQN